MRANFIGSEFFKIPVNLTVNKSNLRFHRFDIKFVTIIISLLINLLSFSQPASGWQWLHPKPQGAQLTKCKYWSANTFYATGEYGLFMKTTDGGNTWFMANDAGRLTYDSYDGLLRRKIVMGMHFFNMNTGITCGGDGLMKTTNAGLTWDSIPGVFTNSQWNNIFFLNNSTGYCVSANGKLIKTTNGGNNWFPNLTIPNGYFTDIFTSNDTIILVSTLNNGSIRRSSDCGITWSTILTGGSFLTRINFMNRDTGFVCTGDSKVLMTTDAGITWSNISNGLPNTEGFSDIDFRISGSLKEIYITGNQNYIYHTSNFGVLWDTVGFRNSSQIYSGHYNCTDLGAGDTLITCGNYGLLNKRNSMTNVVSFSDRKKGGAYLGTSDIWVENVNGKIWSVGQPANSSSFDQIIYSSNGGINWSLQPISNSTTSIFTICMLNTMTGYVAGTGGNVFKTVNGGSNWNQLPGPSLSDIHKIKFVDVNTGWTFGNSGSVFKTVNGGLNWEQQNSGVTNTNIYSADMINANTGWFALGTGQVDSFMVRKTTDGGLSWIGQNANSGVNALFDIRMLNANTGYLGGNQVMRKTTNGGVNWNTVLLPIANYFQVQSMDFLDPMKGVIFYSEHLLITTDGGTSWNISIINTNGVVQIPNTWNKLKLISGYIYITAKYSGILKDSIADLLVGSINWQNSVPNKYELYQNYPNPFNPLTTIKFTIPKPGNVILKFHDITGREVRTIIDNMGLNEGTITFQFDGTNLASGIYFYSLIVDGEKIDSKKMLLIK